MSLNLNIQTTKHRTKIYQTRSIFYWKTDALIFLIVASCFLRSRFLSRPEVAGLHSEINFSWSRHKLGFKRVKKKLKDKKLEFGFKEKNFSGKKEHLRTRSREKGHRSNSTEIHIFKYQTFCPTTHSASPRQAPDREYSTWVSVQQVEPYCTKLWTFQTLICPS